MGTQENTSSRLAIAPARQTEILPSATRYLVLTCPTPLPPVWPLKNQPSTPSPAGLVMVPPTWPGAILLPYHVDDDSELQQPLQGSHPPVPGHHILLSFVIQKPPACQGPWGAHAPSSCLLPGHMSQHSSCGHSRTGGKAGVQAQPGQQLLKEQDSLGQIQSPPPRLGSVPTPSCPPPSTLSRLPLPDPGHAERSSPCLLPSGW